MQVLTQILETMSSFGDGGILGVDIGTYGTKLLRASGGKGSLKFPSLVLQPSLPEQTELKKVVGSKKLSHHRAAFSIADEKIENHEFRLPKLAGKELQTAIDWEIKKAVASPEFAFHDVLTYEDTEGVDVQCIVASKDVVQSRFDEARGAGLSPKILETESAALLAVLKLFHEGKEIERAVIFDLGHSAFRLIFIHKGRVSFTRSLYLGMGPIVQAMTADGQVTADIVEGLFKKLSVEPTPDFHPALPVLERQMQESLYTLCEEFRRSEFFAKDQKGLDEADDIYLCGGGACFPYTLQYLQNHLTEKKITSLNPFEWAKKLPEGHDVMTGPLWACALGLSLRSIR